MSKGSILKQPTPGIFILRMGWNNILNAKRIKKVLKYFKDHLKQHYKSQKRHFSLKISHFGIYTKLLNFCRIK